MRFLRSISSGGALVLGLAAPKLIDTFNLPDWVWIVITTFAIIMFFAPWMYAIKGKYLVGFIGLLLLLVVSGSFKYCADKKNNEISLYDLFLNDNVVDVTHGGNSLYYKTLYAQPDKEYVTDFCLSLGLNKIKNTKFVSIYIPDNKFTEKFLGALFENLEKVIEPNTEETVMIHQGVIESIIPSNNLIFTGEVFIYHETPINLDKQVELIGKYKEKKDLTIKFKSHDYVQAKREENIKINHKTKCYCVLDSNLPKDGACPLESSLNKY